MSDAAKVVVTNSGAIRVTVSRVRAAYTRAGSQRLTAGEITQAITFTTSLPDTNWVWGGLVVGNYTDNPNITPQITAHPITAPSQSGFTVRFSAPPPTDNYYLYWSIAEAFSP